MKKNTVSHYLATAFRILYVFITVAAVVAALVMLNIGSH